MGRGRAPCCDKSKVKRGPWSPSEDLRLISFIQRFGHDNWRSLPNQAGLLRCGKSCRLRWINYLRPDVKRGNFTKEEEDTIITLHKSIGNKWSRIAAHLPGRTDNEIKNVWNTYLKKRLLPSPPNDDASSSAVSPSPSSSSCSAPFVDSAAKADASSVIGPAVVEQLVPPQRQSRESSLSLKQEQLTSSGSSNLYQERDSDRHFNQPGREESLLENVMEEVDKPERGMENNEIEMEVPLEFDHDFWELLDNLETMPARVEGAEVRTTNSEGEAWGVGIIGGEEGNWLRRLERELGLEVSAEDCGLPWELLY